MNLETILPYLVSLAIIASIAWVWMMQKKQAKALLDIATDLDLRVKDIEDGNEGKTD